MTTDWENQGPSVSSHVEVQWVRKEGNQEPEFLAKA